MKMVNVLWILLVVVSLLLAGCQTEVTKQVSAKRVWQPLMYHIASDNGEAYIIGAQNGGKRTYYPATPAVEMAFERADTIVTEVVSDKAAIEQVRRASRLPNGVELSDLLTEEAFHHLKTIIAGQNIAYETIKMLHPNAIELLLSRIAMEEIGVSEAYGTETYFLQRRGLREHIGLRPVNDYVSEWLPPLSKQQAVATTLRLQGSRETADDLEQMTRSFERADEQQLRYLRHELHFKKERNEQLALKVEQLLQRKRTYFILLEIGHLVGEQSVVAQLRRTNDKVTRLQ